MLLNFFCKNASGNKDIMGSKPGVDTHPAPGLEPQLARVTLLNEIFIVLNLGSVKHPNLDSSKWIFSQV